MRRLAWLAWLAWPAALLVTLALASCGGGSCREGCDRLRSCAQGLSCATMDPLQQPVCTRNKKELLALDCEKVDLLCPDAIKGRLEQAATCTLNPLTCDCR